MTEPNGDFSSVNWLQHRAATHRGPSARPQHPWKQDRPGEHSAMSPL